MHHRPLTSVFFRITAYYAVAIIVLAILISRAPWAVDYLPLGTAERLFSPPPGPGFLGGQPDIHSVPTLAAGHSTRDNVVYLVLCFLSALFFAVPVAAAYRATTQAAKSQDPSTIRMILLLPITVAGLVLIVQNSLALAFSLAGLIAGAGVRFRTRVKAMSDTLYFMVAISIGLAAGVGALGISVMMSMVFCYAVLVIHLIESPLSQSADSKEERAKDEDD